MATPSTPFSASNHPPALSPHGPRSVVPSPQQLKKSPSNTNTNSNTIYGYPVGGHPTNSSFGVGYDSPSAAMALGGVPGLELGLEGLGVPGMGGGMANDDERKRKMGQLIDTLQTSKGRLSENGVERLARRMGLDPIFDIEDTTVPRTLIIAGKALSLDIEFDHDVVKKVILAFPEALDMVTRHTGKAEAILLKDLQFQAHESPLTKKLDRFAANLEILAASDKLSVIPGLNCHEAIAGIYESVERLHLWEVDRLKETQEMAERSDAYVVKTAMCTKSGKPVIHARDRLGLSLEYWQERRRLASDKPEKTWSLVIQCAPISDLVYTPLRVSQHWISDDIQKADATAEDRALEPDNGPVLDWQEPESTLLPPTDPPKADGMEGLEGLTGQKYPEVMFVAKFDPPLVVPYTLASQIYASTVYPMVYYGSPHFDALLFPLDAHDIEHDGMRIIPRERTVTAYSKEGVKLESKQTHELWIEKADFGYTLTELPFSHPKQLVEMLPALRQYAFLSTVLNNSFGAGTKVPPEPPRKTDRKKAELNEFLQEVEVQRSKNMDVVLTTQPDLRLRVIFACGNTKGDVTFEIRLNGVVEVKLQNLLTEGGDWKGLTVKDLGRMLEITEDLGVWAEFVKGRLG
ncbi:hypothetical protein LZ554_000770 [Drepanopeziza brunnea f. sp. 'monogermtubi']|nr:hypothetical protein LZ554_000770 [Drepanopeziza brunnea f. sp. 'monogermtubi']